MANSVPEATPAPKPAKPPRRTSHLVVFISLSVIAVLLLAAVGVEFYARHAVKSCIRDQFPGAEVSVDLAAKPVLLQLWDRQLPYVQVNAVGDGSVPPPWGVSEGLAIDARLDVVDINGTADAPGSISGSSASVSWDREGLLNSVRSEGLGRLATGLTTSPNGDLRFQIGRKQLGAHVTVNVTLKNGKLDVVTKEVDIPLANTLAELFGVDKTDTVDGLLASTKKALNVFPFGMKPTSFAVTSEEVKLDLKGGPFTFKGADDAKKVNREAPRSCRI